MFSMIFGSDKFVDIIGELKMVSMMDIDENCKDPAKLMKIRQSKREVQLAVNLVEKLNNYSNISIEDNTIEIEQKFIDKIAEEAIDLSKSTFGGTLL